MLGTLLHTAIDYSPSTAIRLPVPYTVSNRLLRWLIVFAYAGLIAVLAVLAGIIAVYAGTVLPTSFGTVILRWFTAVVAIAASPNIAQWLLRRLLT